MGDEFQPRETLRPGISLDGYQLLFALARGGMATVWAGRLVNKHNVDKIVAIKTISAEYAVEASFRTMFLDEARLAARIDHPNVASLIELGESQGTLYQVLEWVNGVSLEQVRKKWSGAGAVRMPLSVVLRVCADACAGLQAAHEVAGPDGLPINLVHRDISPHNIMVSRAGVAKIIDFGIAKAISRLSPPTQTGSVKGKLKYMAPEQAFSKEIDRRADLWAMGAVLRALVIGETPYTGASELETLHSLASGTPPAPLPEFIPEPVREIIARALTFNVEGRYATANEMKVAIEAAIRTCDLRASIDDVSMYVERVFGDELDRRAATIREAMQALANNAANRTSAASYARIAPEPIVPVIPGFLPAPQIEQDQTVSTSPVVVRPDRKMMRSRVALGVAGAAIIAVAGLFGVLLGRGDMEAARSATRSSQPLAPDPPASSARPAHAPSAAEKRDDLAIDPPEPRPPAAKALAAPARPPKNGKATAASSGASSPAPPAPKPPHPKNNPLEMHLNE